MADIKALEVFYWTATLESFSGAADRCRITQSAVSQRIAALEIEFGHTLIIRKNRSFELTSKGVDLLGFAEQFLRLQSEMTAVMASRKAAISTLRLGCVECIAHTWLNVFLAKMNASHPCVAIDVSLANSDQLEADLRSAKIDLAFLAGPTSHQDLVGAPIGDMELTWVVSPGTGISEPLRKIDDLEPAMVVTSSRETMPYKFVESLISCSSRSTPKVCASGSLTTLVKMVTDSAAVGLIPREVVCDDLKTGRLTMLRSEIPLPTLTFFVSYCSKFANDIARNAFETAQVTSLEWRSSVTNF